MRHARLWRSGALTGLTLAAFLAAGACTEKGPGFFDTTGLSDEPAGVPGEILTGSWDIDYNPVNDPCELVQGPFQVPATIDFFSSTGELSVSFPDAPKPILGPYEPSTGKFWGTTGSVDLGEGVTAEEEWDVTFMPTSFQNGSSMVLFDFGGGETCPVDYSISGERTGP